MSNDVLGIKIDGKPLVGYQAKPLSNPKGGDKFKASNFIHPLKTPSGFMVTELQPGDHGHHLGLWWPWKYLEVENGRKVLCWELQKGDGLIQAQESSATKNGFTAKSIYIDRKAPGGPRTILNETLNVKTSGITDKPLTGYSLDLEIIHEVAGNKPIVVSKYRYSGFAFRGAASWKKKTSTILTSEGKGRDDSNSTRGKWVRIQGNAEKDAQAGVLLMSHPANHDHPEKLRTWNSKTHHGSVFINFNSVQDKSWTFEPGKQYPRHFRVFVYDGELTAEQAEALWKTYAKEKQ